LNFSAMDRPPFTFLSAQPVAVSTACCLFGIQLFSDTLQRFILVRGHISPDAYQQTDFAKLQLDFPVALERAVVKRQAEYLAGRYLSRLAMEQSGLFEASPPQIGSSQLRAPLWPERVTGSITHHQYTACVVLLTQPLAADNFVGIDAELWLTEQQAREIALSVHHPEELAILVRAGFTVVQATTLLFSAKEALFKAICPFVGEYFGFEAAELKACSEFAAATTTVVQGGWLQLDLVTDWVAARAPQQNYRCWFSCSETDVLTLVCSDAISAPWVAAATWTVHLEEGGTDPAFDLS
jgi:enterobactin synthetase component D